MTMQSPYRKARASNSQGACVEAGVNQPGRVVVRDTKDTPGPELTFRPRAWAAFLGTVRARL